MQALQTCSGGSVCVSELHLAQLLNLLEFQRQDSKVQRHRQGCVCVYYCSAFDKAVRVCVGGKVEDMCYERRRAEAGVD